MLAAHHQNDSREPSPAPIADQLGTGLARTPAPSHHHIVRRATTAAASASRIVDILLFDCIVGVIPSGLHGPARTNLLVNAMLTRSKSGSRVLGDATAAAAEALGYGGASHDQPFWAFMHQALVGAEHRQPSLDLLGHSRRVEATTARLCLALGMSRPQAVEIAAASLFHDIGKLSLPIAILTRPGPLRPDERRLVNQHCEIGASLMAQEASAFACVARNIALWHHQRFDGSGYPGGLAGRDIPAEARIVAVADVYDALRSERPYKPAQGHDNAVRVMVYGDERLPQGSLDTTASRLFATVSSTSV